jgi:hypothetical protein
MRVRLMAALSALVLAAFPFAAITSADAADLRYGYRSVHHRAKAYRTAHAFCVPPSGYDDPPFGYGCIDKWVKRYRITHVVQRDIFGQARVDTYGTTRILRRYGPVHDFTGYAVVPDERETPAYCYDCY